MKKSIAFLCLFLMPAVVLAQDGGHRTEMNRSLLHGKNHGVELGTMMDSGRSAVAGIPHEGGQSAFAAIQEISALLQEDPATDWAKVDIEALRRHLIDMDNVTLRASVETFDESGAIRFEATGATASVADSIRRMTLAHAHTMNGVNGWTLEAHDLADGAALTVTPSHKTDLEMVRGLGFIGIMTVGMHHQEHHIAIARGHAPH